MTEIVAFLFVGIGIGTACAAIRRPSIFTAFAATLGLFSLGYYALPLLLPDMAGLGAVPRRDLDAVALMSVLYVGCVLVGLVAAVRATHRLPAMTLPTLDRLAAKHWWPVALVASGAYLLYIRTGTLTSYEASDFDAYFQQRSVLFAITAFFASLSLAALSVDAALAVRGGGWGARAFIAATFAYIEYRLAGGAQRLLFITPIFMVFAALVATGQHRVAGSALVAGVAALLLISPFAVALRSTRSGGTHSQLGTASVSYGQGFGRTTLRSIAERSDLIYDMTYLKPYIDRHGFVGPLFYTSVLMIPVPRLVMPDKPYVLSDTGRADGEASTLAWNIIVGHDIGSLTAFGPIVAYREGGWPAVMVDGLAVGALFALVLGVFARGGFTGHMFLAMAFVAFTVAKVPTSFFEALAQVLTYLPILVGLWLLDRIAGAALVGRARRRRRAGVSPSAS